MGICPGKHGIFCKSDNPQIGDACDDDDDNDELKDGEDNCSRSPNPDQSNVDGDARGDACDNCPDDSQQSFNDEDLDDVGTLCDNCPGTGFEYVHRLCSEHDADHDGWQADFDNCPDDVNPDQSDINMNEMGDACDPDIDSDNITNLEDNCPYVYNPGQEDCYENDTRGDACEGDEDGDGVADYADACPRNPNCTQTNFEDPIEILIYYNRDE